MSRPAKQYGILICAFFFLKRQQIFGVGYQMNIDLLQRALASHRIGQDVEIDFVVDD
jgi:hypothetical protein